MHACYGRIYVMTVWRKRILLLCSRVNWKHIFLVDTFLKPQNLIFWLIIMYAITLCCLYLFIHFNYCVFFCILKCIHTFVQMLISYIRVTQRFKLLQRKALYKYLFLLFSLLLWFIYSYHIMILIRGYHSRFVWKRTIVLLASSLDILDHLVLWCNG